MYNCHIRSDAFERSNRVSIELSEVLRADADVTDTDQLVLFFVVVVACLVNLEESAASVCFNLAVASQVRVMI